MAQHPDRYDYSAAKIPSPLTEDMEKERKAKMAEKKKALKKAKKQREKVKATDESVCIVFRVGLLMTIIAGAEVRRGVRTVQVESKEGCGQFE